MNIQDRFSFISVPTPTFLLNKKQEEEKERQK